MLPFVSVMVVLIIFARQSRLPSALGPAVPSRQPLMRLTDEFTPRLAPDRAYELLLDLAERGALRARRRDRPARRRRRLSRARRRSSSGPMRFSYAGTLRIAERDAAARRAVIEGAGKASGGAERAKVRASWRSWRTGDGSRVRMTTDLDIRGRAAQMGAGIIGGVSRHMVKQAASAWPKRAPTEADQQSGATQAASTMTKRSRHVRTADLTLTRGARTTSRRASRPRSASPIQYHYDPVVQGALPRDRARRRARSSAAPATRSSSCRARRSSAWRRPRAASSGPGTSCLNLVSGVFGKGFGYWLSGIGADLHEIEVPYDEAVTAEAVDAYLTRTPSITVVSVVHSETPSGTLNPVWDIGPIAGRHGAVTVVDAVSSFGGIELRARRRGSSTCSWPGPQKCLGGPPGMSLMAVSEQRLGGDRREPRRAARLVPVDHSTGATSGTAQGRFPYTPSVSDLHGVHAAADELLEEGLDGVDRAAPARLRCLLGRRGGHGPAAVAGQQGRSPPPA